MHLRLLTPALALLLVACDIPGLGPDPRIAQREADGKAIGAACRHAIRGIEECYRQNERAVKTFVFEGWKEMDQYMRDNKIEGIAPKEVRVVEVQEVIPDDKKPKTAAADGKSADTKAKGEVTLKPVNTGEKSIAAKTATN
ncbi:MAG: hypothetical protein LH632_00070 [Rhodoferax sp.]|nr:hypothetical protein [Rhodoferax sp.]